MENENMENESAQEQIRRFRAIFESLKGDETVIKPYLGSLDRRLTGIQNGTEIYLDYLLLRGARENLLGSDSYETFNLRNSLDLALRKFGIRDPEFRERNIDDKQRAVSIIRNILAARAEIAEDWHRNIVESGWLDE